MFTSLRERRRERKPRVKNVRETPHRNILLKNLYMLSCFTVLIEIDLIFYLLINLIEPLYIASFLATFKIEVLNTAKASPSLAHSRLSMAIPPNC